MTETATAVELSTFADFERILADALPERIVSKIVFGDGCWGWKGYCTDKGYGQVSFDGRLTYIHIVVYEFLNGKLPPGLCVLHRCDNPPCPNPDHLWAGTKAENNADMNAKGRARGGSLPGAAHPMVKLTLIEVEEIRSRASRGQSQRSIARDFSVSQRQIGRILHGESWK